MVQGADRASFALQPFQRVRIVVELFARLVVADREDLRSDESRG
jgi:hypothetical protein